MKPFIPIAGYHMWFYGAVGCIKNNNGFAFNFYCSSVQPRDRRVDPLFRDIRKPAYESFWIINVNYFLSPALAIFLDT